MINSSLALLILCQSGSPAVRLMTDPKGLFNPPLD